MLREQEKFSRVARIPWIGKQGLARLQASTAAVLGVGNIGGQVAQHLALLGMNLVLVDRDVVKTENLGTQGFAAKGHVGLPKVVARRRFLSSLNPSCRIETIHADIRSLGLGALRKADVLFCCLDSRAARVAVNEIAMRLGICWVDTAVDGSGTMLFGRVAAYDTISRASACYLCPHDGKSLLEIMNKGAPQGCPVWRWDTQEEVGEPTLAISPLGGAVASVAVITGLELLLGRGSRVVSRELYLDLDHFVFSTHVVKRNPRCICDHRVFVLTPLEGERRLSVADTIRWARRKLGGEVVLQLQHRSVTSRIRCPACSREKEPFRILESLGRKEATCRCGRVMQPLATGLLDRFTWDQAGGFLHKSWKELGLPAEDVVVASSGNAELALLVS